MADVLSKFTRTSRYPWDQWGDGRVWRCKQGRDFHTSIRGFRTAIYTAAYRVNCKARVTQKKKGKSVWIEFQFLRDAALEQKRGGK